MGFIEDEVHWSMMTVIFSVQVVTHYRVEELRVNDCSIRVVDLGSVNDGLNTHAGCLTWF